ncbi:NUDIX hydrolase domain-like protein [Trichoderma velutinum]
MSDDIPRVGVSAIIQRGDGKVVVGKRKSGHGAGGWHLPGGHLEHKEEPLICAERETMEETGLKVKGIKVLITTNDVFTKENPIKHYITLVVVCSMIEPDAEPQAREREKCEEWVWKSWEELKDIHAAASDLSSETLFLPLANLIEQNCDINSSFIKSFLPLLK